MNKSVGLNQTNNKEDVIYIQTLINELIDEKSYDIPKLKIDGICGSITIDTIKNIQKILLVNVDGIINPLGTTLATILNSLPITLITETQLRAIMPNAINDRIISSIKPLNEALVKYEINTKMRISAFIAQIAHETMEFKYFEEIWGPTKAQRKYDGRKDLGNIHLGDGFRYKGRGPIQITGRSNYETYGKLLNIDLINHPELASLPEYGFLIAALFWTTHNLNKLADKRDFKTITKIINGGFIGYDDRMRYYNKALAVL